MEEEDLNLTDFPATWAVDTEEGEEAQKSNVLPSLMKPASQDKVFIREAAASKSLDGRSVLPRRSTNLRLNYLIEQTGAAGGGCAIPVPLCAALWYI